MSRYARLIEAKEAGARVGFAEIGREEVHVGVVRDVDADSVTILEENYYEGSGASEVTLPLCAVVIVWSPPSPPTREEVERMRASWASLEDESEDYQEATRQ